MADITTDDFFPNAVLAPKDAKGRPAPVEAGSVVWASSDDTILSVTPSADGMTAVVTSVGAGTARISVSADADLGAGVVTITGVSEDVNVANGNIASVMSLDLGASQPKP